VRIAILYPNLLYPGIRFSGAIRTVKLVDHLRDRHDVTLVTFCDPSEAEHRDAAEAWGRTFAGYEIVDLPRRGIVGKLTKRLGRSPLGVAHYRVDAMRTRLRGLAATFAPHVLHVEFTFLAEYGACVDPLRTARVLVDQELYFRKYERLLAQPHDGSRRAKVARLMHRWEMRKYRRFEPRAAAGYDHVLSITAEERDALWELDPSLPITVYPNIVDAEEFPPRDVPERDDTLLFVGNYAHPPNRDALAWLLSDLFPAIRAKAPGARPRLVGAGLDDAIAAVQGDAPLPPGVEKVGFADDLVDEIARAAVFVCPVRTGGGMRGKNLEAMATECAVVTTPVGAEGTEIVHDRHALVAEDADAFASAVVELFADPARRRRLGQAGRLLVRSLYDAEVVFGDLQALYAKLARAKRVERVENALGGR